MFNEILKTCLINKKWSRRDFLKSASLATLGALTAGLPKVSFGMERKLLDAKADSVILLWMAGGMAHTETFDPKDHIPFRKGIRYQLVKSTCDKIPTSLDDIFFSEGLENIAKHADKMTLVRSFQPPDLGHVLHARHQYHWHTGYAPPQTVSGPHIGAMIAKALGPKNPNMPSFVHVGQRLDIDGSPEVKAFLTPGFLGHEYAPLLIPFPEEASKIMSPPEGMSEERFVNRYKFYKKLSEMTPIGEFGSGYQKDSLINSIDNSFKILSSDSAKAFDLSLEPKDSYDEYNTGRFGRGCLLARRLVEQGARFVEVTTEHVPFGNWDTHHTGHGRVMEMKKLIDRPIAKLISDLDRSGRLDKTLIIIASEFSRTTVLDPKSVQLSDPKFLIRGPLSYGLHRHYTGAGTVLCFGGDFKRGHVYGKTADEVPCQTIENPAKLIDIHATIFRALGIPADASFDVEKRPYYITKDGKGEYIADLLNI